MSLDVHKPLERLCPRWTRLVCCLLPNEEKREALKDADLKQVIL